MIKIKTNVVAQEEPITDVMLKYEVKNAEVGEYLAILDKVKNELLENSNLDEETLQDILFGKEED